MKKTTIIVLVIILIIVAILTTLVIVGYSSFKTFFTNENNIAGDLSEFDTKSQINQTQETLQLENYDGGFFTIQKPVGWNVNVGGNCSTFSFVIQDPNNPARMIFYFGEIGPVYLSENQKQVDRDYMSMGGYDIAWLNMPVISPLTPDNFLKNMCQISGSSFVQQFMTGIPSLNNTEIISSSDAKSIVSGNTKLIRALFKESDNFGEGLFFLTTAEVLPETGMPAGGIGYGITFIGISAGRSEFRNLEKTLNESINSLNISQDYISKCLAQQQKQYQAILKAGQALSEASDIIVEGWENRNRSDDIVSEKRSDAILERDRIYNPDSGEVYDIKNGWYDNYDLHRGNYDMNNLQPLPSDNYDLWTAPTLDEGNIH